MRRALTAGLAVALGAGLVSCGGDDDAVRAGGTGTITVADAWARTTPGGVSIGAAYLTIDSSADDELVGAEVGPEIAARVELHATTETAGSTSMGQVAGLPVPADGELVLAPIGNHFMLVGLTEPLVAGASFALTLHFTRAGDVPIEVAVRDDAP